MSDRREPRYGLAEVKRRVLAGQLPQVAAPPIAAGEKTLILTLCRDSTVH